MDTTLQGADAAFSVLSAACRDKRVLSVGYNLGGTVLQLAAVTRVMWQIGFPYEGHGMRARLHSRRHINRAGKLVDAGKLVQIDALPSLVLSNLHEDSFDVVFLHGHTGGKQMTGYLQWVKFLCTTILVHDPGTQEARDAVHLFAQEQGVPVAYAGLLTTLTAPAARRGGVKGWL